MTKCIVPAGRTSQCAMIATHLIETRANVQRVASKACRSRKKFAEYADELAAAKAEADMAREWRDRHMAECPAAAERFGVSA